MFIIESYKIWQKAPQFRQTLILDPILQIQKSRLDAIYMKQLQTFHKLLLVMDRKLQIVIETWRFRKNWKLIELRENYQF